MVAATVAAMNGSALNVVALLAAFALAFTFVVAAVAKLRSPVETAEDFRSLGLPRPDLAARLVPAVELVTAAALILSPGWGAVCAFAILAAFTATLAAVVRSGRVVSCACFGGTSSAPVSKRHLVRNGVLLVLALVATVFDGWVWNL